MWRLLSRSYGARMQVESRKVRERIDERLVDDLLLAM